MNGMLRLRRIVRCAERKMSKEERIQSEQSFWCEVVMWLMRRWESEGEV
jgi:hypothetical protein